MTYTDWPSHQIVRFTLASPTTAFDPTGVDASLSPARDGRPPAVADCGLAAHRGAATLRHHPATACRRRPCGRPRHDPPGPSNARLVPSLTLAAALVVSTAGCQRGGAGARPHSSPLSPPTPPATVVEANATVRPRGRRRHRRRRGRRPGGAGAPHRHRHAGDEGSATSRSSATGPRPRRSPSRCCPEGTAVRLERDVEARDDYGRLLAYVRRGERRAVREPRAGPPGRRGGALDPAQHRLRQRDRRGGRRGPARQAGPVGRLPSPVMTRPIAGPCPAPDGRAE